MLFGHWSRRSRALGLLVKDHGDGLGFPVLGTTRSRGHVGSRRFESWPPAQTDLATPGAVDLWSPLRSFALNGLTGAAKRGESYAGCMGRRRTLRHMSGRG